MGLGGLISAWQRQIKDFGHSQSTQGDQSPKYSCLFFDNRGMGKSDKPLVRYSTSEMARDTLELINHVGWTAQRQLHVIGISMGGMIAQELVCHSLRSYGSKQRGADTEVGSHDSRKNPVVVNACYWTQDIQHRRVFSKP